MSIIFINSGGRGKANASREKKIETCTKLLSFIGLCTLLPHLEVRSYQEINVQPEVISSTSTHTAAVITKVLFVIMSYTRYKNTVSSKQILLT